MYCMMNKTSAYEENNNYKLNKWTIQYYLIFVLDMSLFYQMLSLLQK